MRRCARALTLGPVAPDPLPSGRRERGLVRRQGPVVVACCLALSFGCGGSGGSPAAPSADSRQLQCGPYPDWRTSPYVLPYPVGRSHRVSQGNCFAGGSHQSTLRHSYDFEMPFGSVVTAARAGVVHAIRVSQPAGARGLTASNWLQIDHGDGTLASYVHLAEDGALVRVGDAVAAGDPLALTGDTGDVGSFPHLHFDVHPCESNLRCTTLPVTFRNTEPNPRGPQMDGIYPALDG